jgi:hypothetical protein
MPTTRYHHLLAARSIFFIFFITFFPVKKIKKNRVGSPVVAWWEELGTADRQPEGIVHHISWQERSAVARRTEQQP